MYSTMERTKQLLKEKICEVVNKNDISLGELECLEKAYAILNYIASIEAMGFYTKEDASFRRPMYRGREFSMGAAFPVYDDMVRQYDHTMPPDKHSYHSVNDRIISNLEHELNNNLSDFERQRLMDEIRRLREMKD